MGASPASSSNVERALAPAAHARVGCGSVYEGEYWHMLRIALCKPLQARLKPSRQPGTVSLVTNLS
jgi:hypothetical protein